MSISIAWNSSNYNSISQQGENVSIVNAQTNAQVFGIETQSLDSSNTVLNVQSTQVTNPDGTVTLFEIYTVSLYVYNRTSIGDFIVRVSYNQQASSDPNFTTLSNVSDQSVTAHGCFANYDNGIGVIQFLSTSTTTTPNRILTVYLP